MKSLKIMFPVCPIYCSRTPFWKCWVQTMTRNPSILKTKTHLLEAHSIPLLLIPTGPSCRHVSGLPFKNLKLLWISTNSAVMKTLKKPQLRSQKLISAFQLKTYMAVVVLEYPVYIPNEKRVCNTFILTGEAPTTKVWATTAGKPSMWAPRSILTMSPSFNTTSGSDFSGEKWHTQWLTERQVGNAIPAIEKQLKFIS